PSLAALARAARASGGEGGAGRGATFLADSDPAAAEELTVDWPSRGSVARSSAERAGSAAWPSGPVPRHGRPCGTVRRRPAGGALALPMQPGGAGRIGDRKSTRLNSSHVEISYAVFCL